MQSGLDLDLPEGHEFFPTERRRPEIRATAEFERRWLPLPHERVVMCRFFGTPA